MPAARGHDTILAATTAAARVLMKDPESETADGDSVVPAEQDLTWVPVVFHPDPEGCDHTESMCGAYECLMSWQADWWVEVLDTNGDTHVLNDDYPGRGTRYGD